MRGRRGSLVGWLLLGITNLVAFSLLVTAIASGGQRGEVWAEAAGWLSLWLAAPSIAGFIVIVLIFPIGRVLSQRWSAVFYAAVAGMALMTFGLATRPGPIDSAPQLDNPIGIPALDGIRGLRGTTPNPLGVRVI